MKIGLDIHGVLDKHLFLKELAALLVSNGHEVHIITGAMWENKSNVELEQLGIMRGIHYTHFFSIADTLLSGGAEVEWKDDVNPVFDEYLWNKIKGDYCKNHNIDFHLDDSDIYGKYFSTPYAHLHDNKKGS